MQRKRYSSEEKTRVALEAIRGQKTLNELAAEYGVHPSQISQGKKQALDAHPQGLLRRACPSREIRRRVGGCVIPRDGSAQGRAGWAKQKSASPLEEKRALIEPAHPEISIARQCELLGLARSSS